MTIGLQALGCILGINVQLFERVQNLSVDWNVVVPDDDAFGSLSVFIVYDHPGVLPDLGYGVPMVRVHRDKLANEIAARFRNTFMHLEFALQNLVVEVVGVLIVFEGEIATEHGEKYHSSRPDVDFNWLVAKTLKHFRGCVARGTTGSLQQIIFLVGVREAEIHDFNIFF